MSVTADVSHFWVFWIGWLKDSALENMPLMLVTVDVFQFSIGWLKELARANMRLMLITDDVFQAPIGAVEGIGSVEHELISVTADVFQDPMVSLKYLRYDPENNPDILVTSEMSHSAMSPYLEIKRGLSLREAQRRWNIPKALRLMLMMLRCSKPNRDQQNPVPCWLNHDIHMTSTCVCVYVSEDSVPLIHACVCVCVCVCVCFIICPITFAVLGGIPHF